MNTGNALICSETRDVNCIRKTLIRNNIYCKGFGSCIESTNGCIKFSTTSN